ncbi:putative transferase [Cucumis melo var. makuwa]|uniref:Transferase At1g60990, chloroplastic isoform X1 n=2 Tax=Cucumis melo TaxID=3656 RepID=A0ABM3KTP5_CUCME|nr:putative transferase At1g60990, chloroplastic isoform X1 [Cucumis melo]TYK13394.1 putative transferase [Cucumis melo var. makuwa]
MSASYCGYGFFVSDSTVPSTSRAFISNSCHWDLSISSFSHPHRLQLPPFRPPNIKKPHSNANRKSTSFSALPFDLSPPPIDEDLLEAAAVEGARISDDGIIETFHNDEQALDAANNGVAVVDLSHFGRLRVSGDDRCQFLHNQSTANFESLRQGQGCSTVFVTPTARTIDIAQAWIMKNAITLIVSPVTRESIIRMLNKYIFLADKVEIQDITNQTSLLVLVGPKSNQIMEDLNLGSIAGEPYGTHQHFSVNGMPITVGVGSVISEEGFSLLISPAVAGPVWKALVSLGAVPMGSRAWEKLRIFQGMPSPQKELTDEFNVLEAGLWNSISLNKGCYKGQETISRLITYDGVKQRLWGLQLSDSVEPGSPITIDGKRVGKLTSYAPGRKESEHFGLGYIKKKAASIGDTVIVGEDTTGTVVEVPFLARQQPLSNSSPSSTPESSVQ